MDEFDKAVLVKEIFRAPHEELALDFAKRIVEMLTKQIKIQSYGASDESYYTIETIKVEPAPKVTLEINLRHWK